LKDAPPLLAEVTLNAPSSEKRLTARCPSSKSWSAAVTIRRIEVAAKINKHRFYLKPLIGKTTAASGIWTAVLAGQNREARRPTKHTPNEICTRTTGERALSG
jgi:hypothetical protein